jgi:hypothetical protein
MSEEVEQPTQEVTSDEVQALASLEVSSIEFEDFGAFAPSRLSSRTAEEISDEADDEEEEPDIVRPPRSPHKVWRDKPSVSDQAAKHPGTVKLAAPVTLTLNLSVPAELKKLNEVQKLAAHSDGPLCSIVDLDRRFHDGVWYVYLTYAKILYQQL